VKVTLVDRRNFHLFQPLLYQVATASLSPNNIASVLRRTLRRQENAQVLLAEARGVDAAQRRLLLDDGELRYDTLIVAAGAGQSYFGHDEWRDLAPGLKTIEDAIEIRRRILLAFEAAERTNDPQERERWLTFVIVGAGPTGVELAGAISEIAAHSLKHDFRNIDPSHARIIVVDGGDRVLATFPSTLSAKAATALERRGVTLKTHSQVVGITENEVTYRTEDRDARLQTRTVLWAAGVQASPLGQALAEATGAQLDRAGRVIVQPDLTIPNHPEIFVVGDLANLAENDKPLPGVAQVAMQQGAYAAQLIRHRLDGKSRAPFHYVDLGNMATIGRSAAVVSVGSVHLSGFVAWLAWAFVHLTKLMRFQSRILVFAQWAWLYLTWNRSARLITGKPLLPGSHSKAIDNPSDISRKRKKC
jgi:NADH dehydrogenase